VTTKVWNNDQGRDRTRRAFESSLSKLGLDHLDLYLIHWPAPSRGLYQQTWLTLTGLQREGLVRSIGVSSFEPQHLDRLAEVSDVVPAVNQIELQSFLQQERLRAYHHEHGIVTGSWSHLAEAEVEPCSRSSPASPSAATSTRPGSPSRGICSWGTSPCRRR
jgi:2,5-diketo-D-gluconate reductase A